MARWPNSPIVRSPITQAGASWYWLSVRHYDPATGRHPCAGTRQPDPAEREGTRSYVYCNDDPLDCTDPSGLLSLGDVGNGIYQDRGGRVGPA